MKRTVSYRLLIAGVFSALVLGFLYFVRVDVRKRRTEQARYLHFGEFLTYLDQGRVVDLRIQGQEFTGHLLNGSEFLTIGEPPSDTFLATLHDRKVDLEIAQDDGGVFGQSSRWRDLLMLFLAAVVSIDLLSRAASRR